LCIFGLGAGGERSVFGPDRFTQRETFPTPFGLEASWVQPAQDTAWRKDPLALAENRTPNFVFPFPSLDTVLTSFPAGSPPPPALPIRKFKF